MSGPVRIQRRRTKGWRMPEGAVYVGRPTVWGNPYAVDAGQTSANAVKAYFWLITTATPYGYLAAIRPPVERIGELRGRDLACWCPLDQPCHADVLLEIANTPPAADVQPEQVETEGVSAT